MRRPRLTVRTLMVAVAVVGVGLGALACVDRVIGPHLRFFAYYDLYAPHNSRLAIGQAVVTYRQDGSPVPLWPRGSGTIEAGTKGTVSDETPGDDDGITPGRWIGVVVLEGPWAGKKVLIDRHRLRDPKLSETPTPPKPDFRSR